MRNDAAEVVGPFISLNAARSLPWLKIDGRRLDLSTLYRMARRPRRGRLLRTTYIGGRLATTEQWVREYVEAVADSDAPASAESRAPSRRLRQMRSAEAELAAAGI
jgi:hypothetical protein